eukprot:30013-Pelagococcus_subviridis.AAC.3
MDPRPKGSRRRRCGRSATPRARAQRAGAGGRRRRKSSSAGPGWCPRSGTTCSALVAAATRSLFSRVLHAAIPHPVAYDVVVLVLHALRQRHEELAPRPHLVHRHPALHELVPGRFVLPRRPPAFHLFLDDAAQPSEQRADDAVRVVVHATVFLLYKRTRRRRFPVRHRHEPPRGPVHARLPVVDPIAVEHVRGDAASEADAQVRPRRLRREIEPLIDERRHPTGFVQRRGGDAPRVRVERRPGRRHDDADVGALRRGFQDVVGVSGDYPNVAVAQPLERVQVHLRRELRRAQVVQTVPRRVVHVRRVRGAPARAQRDREHKPRAGRYPDFFFILRPEQIRPIRRRTQTARDLVLAVRDEVASPSIRHAV